MNNHLMQPTPEQFTEWLQEVLRDVDASKVGVICDRIARLAYAAGADAELDACCAVLSDLFSAYPCELRAARRPKPVNIKQKALKVLSGISCTIGSADATILFNALTSLPEE